MTLDQFWQLIEQSRATGGTVEEQVAALEGVVHALPPREMVSFEGHCWDLLSHSFRRELWAVAAVIEPGCSQGSFDAMRAWMILGGREFFERAVAHPSQIADRVPAQARPWHVAGEKLLQMVPQHYQSVTGEEMPTIPRKVPYVIKGTRWTEADLPDMFPELWRKYRS
jgi:Protein of unknown function (DUF4240)